MSSAEMFTQHAKCEFETWKTYSETNSAISAFSFLWWQTAQKFVFYFVTAALEIGISFRRGEKSWFSK